VGVVAVVGVVSLVVVSLDVLCDHEPDPQYDCIID
jgi:hypothetical protein